MTHFSSLKSRLVTVKFERCDKKELIDYINYYNEKLETLPENLQYAVIMSNWKESLVRIQTQFKLHIDQTQVLEDSAIKLMFGDIDAPDFINHMFNDAHINSETAADILLEVDLKILKKIREILEGLRITDEEEEESDATRT